MSTWQTHLGARHSRALFLLRALSCALALLVAACNGDADAASPPDAAPNATKSDPCNGRCESNELCLRDEEGVYACALMCANQLHCWSLCCLPVQGTTDNVCRPSSLCYGPGR
jgi:hypothetical protein